jgi:hypothetical protein
MHFDSTELFLLIGGLLLISFGGLVVFSDRFLAKLDATIWKDTKLDKFIFRGKSGYWFNRYGRGLGALTLGVGMLLLFWQTLVKKMSLFQNICRTTSL